MNRFAVSSSGLMIALLTTAATFSADAPYNASTGAPPGVFTTTAISAHFQASANMYRVREGGGTTWHYGQGYIQPYGAAEYYCGRDYPEQKEIPPPPWVKELFGALTGIPDPLLCIYTVESGLLYVYDGAAGNRIMANDGGLNQIVNVVVGGTGQFAGATGLWLGSAEGRAGATQVIPGRRVTNVLLKIMDGYVKVPGQGK